MDLSARPSETDRIQDLIKNRRPIDVASVAFATQKANADAAGNALQPDDPPSAAPAPSDEPGEPTRIRGRAVGTEAWAVYGNLKEAARALGLHSDDINDCVEERRKYEFEPFSDDSDSEVEEEARAELREQARELVQGADLKSLGSGSINALAMLGGRRKQVGRATPGATVINLRTGGAGGAGSNAVKKMRAAMMAADAAMELKMAAEGDRATPHQPSRLLHHTALRTALLTPAPRAHNA